MYCAKCNADTQGLNFCQVCGEGRLKTAPEGDPTAPEADTQLDRPEALAKYREELADYLGDQGLDDWEKEELAIRREELGISQKAHDKMVEEMGGASADPPPIEIFIDEARIEKFHVGGQSIFSFQIQNITNRAVRSVEISFRDTEFPDGQSRSIKTKPIRPGGAEQGQIVASLEQSGGHELRGEITVVRTGKEPDRFEFIPFLYEVAPQATQATSVFQDFSSARVVDNSQSQFGGAVSASSGAVSERRWIPLEMVRVSTGIQQHARVISRLNELNAIENTLLRFKSLCEFLKSDSSSAVLASTLHSGSAALGNLNRRNVDSFWPDFLWLLEQVHQRGDSTLRRQAIDAVVRSAGLRFEGLGVSPGIACTIIRRLASAGEDSQIADTAVQAVEPFGPIYRVWVMSAMAKAWGASNWSDRAREELSSLLVTQSPGGGTAGSTDSAHNLIFFKSVIERELDDPDFSSEILGDSSQTIKDLDANSESWFESHVISDELVSLIPTSQLMVIAESCDDAGFAEDAFFIANFTAREHKAPSALLLVGKALIDGNGVTADMEKGAKLLREAAEAGYKEAYELLVEIYLLGTETADPVDVELGVKFLKEGATAAVPYCQLMYSELAINESIARDLGVSPDWVDKSESARFLHATASQSDDLEYAIMAKYKILEPYTDLVLWAVWEGGSATDIHLVKKLKTQRQIPIEEDQRVQWCKDILEAEASGIETWLGPNALSANAEAWLKEWSGGDFDAPDALGHYRDEFEDYLDDGVLEQWEEEELTIRRKELKISIAAHLKIIEELAKAQQE